MAHLTGSAAVAIEFLIHFEYLSSTYHFVDRRMIIDFPLLANKV